MTIMNEKTREKFNRFIRKCPYLIQKTFFWISYKRQYARWIKEGIAGVYKEKFLNKIEW